MKNFNLSRAGITSTTLSETISFEELVQYIKDHPNEATIKFLRSQEYKGEEYRRYKNSLPYVMPHATFHGLRKKENADQPTGYIYLDVDKSDLPEGSEAMKKYILEKHANKVTLMCTSVGGCGISIYIRIGNPEVLTIENFDSAYHYVRTVLFHDIPTDNQASGITRTHIIPADPEVYTNLDACVQLPDSGLQTRKTVSSCTKSLSLGYTGNDKFLDIDHVMKRMKTQTTVDVGDLPVLVKDVEYSKLFIPRIIPDGKKHATFRAMVNSIKFNNPDFTLLEILSFVNYINANYTARRPMEIREMKRTVEAEYDRIEKTGEFKCTRNKRYHSNPRDTRIIRIRNVAKVRGEERKQKSIALIAEAVQQLKESGCARPTIKKVATHLKGKLSEVTISRHWRTVVPKRIV
ncbi:BT4734/BF3469 family protein [Pseudocnuella soli]|uniref:BT4734/BF3469 family protein n=1 Tax=Pseudocnuella soli TaxID=2502779 RepID=UPI0010439A29|nr:BT4734/BF3469 family protein [Pseudocnuella soli]